MPITIASALLEAKKKCKNLDAIKYKEKGRWKRSTWGAFYDEVELVALGLKSLGVAKGDRIAIFSNTNRFWQITDLAALGMGAVTVPIYKSNHADEVSYALNDSQAKILFCEDNESLSKYKEIANECPSTTSVVTYFDSNSANCHSWTQLQELGRQLKNENPNWFPEENEKVQLSDMASIIYTSGTTGNPKGAVISHCQIESEINDVFRLLNVGVGDTTLTFLPFAHVVGRVEMWGSIYRHYTIAYAESIEKIKFNLEEVRPTLLIAVPRIFEKIYNGILAQVETNKGRQKVFNWALKIGRKVSQLKVNKEAIPLPLLLKYKLAKTLVFGKIKEKMGGQLRFAFSGGAPLGREIAEFFHAADILVLEGYGLTETTAAISMNTPLDYKFGTVGLPIGDAQFKIADDGEILVKSNKVMLEYYKNPDATKEVFIDGYFATGDIGEFTDDGFLRITDRKKDLIKTAGGKYVAPQKLEGLLKLNPYVSNVLIHGDKRKYIVALVTLDEGSIRQYAIDQEIPFSDVESLSQNDQIRNLVHEAVTEVNSQVASFETIKNFEILPRDFTIESGELTPSLKVKRKVCDQKFANEIDRLYGTDRSSL